MIFLSGEKSVEVLLTHALWEESDDFGEVTGMGAEFVECQGSEGELDSSRQVQLAVACSECPRPVCDPPLGQPIVDPHILRCSGREECYREDMES